jgi:phosphoglucomutase
MDQDQRISPLAGKPAPRSLLVDIPKLLTAYIDRHPDPAAAAQRIAFGTSGHRGSAFECSFNERHILAIGQAICDYRRSQKIDGPLFLGIDTHALSMPAFATALEVLAGNGVETLIAKDDEFTPTPAISHAILLHNRARRSGLADGIVITPSHNGPDSGGLKYNPPHGGPADTEITTWVQRRANALLERGLEGVRHLPLAQARTASTTGYYAYLDTYVADLCNIVDFDVIRGAGVRMGVDPLGGAGVHYWGRIADDYRLDLSVVNDVVDPQFGFMTLDWDGQIRMDPSSPHAMARLIGMRADFDLALGNDADADRFGVVTPGAGLLNPNHFLAAAAWYLFGGARTWRVDAAIGKTLVSSSLQDRIAAALGRRLFEVPVGFKWFVDGLLDGSVAFGGEESAGLSFLRRDGSPWSTDKDGIIACLLAAELTARSGRDPGASYDQLTERFGAPHYRRIDAPATPAQKAALGHLRPERIAATELAGDPITARLTHAPGNDAPIGGLKVVTARGWFAARPSGTEDVTKLYTESFVDEAHLDRIIAEAHAIIEAALQG